MYTHKYHENVAVWLADPVAKAFHKVIDCAATLAHLQLKYLKLIVSFVLFLLGRNLGTFLYMYACVCVCMYICMYVCMYVCTPISS